MAGNAVSILEHETGGSTKGSLCIPLGKNRCIAVHTEVHTGRSDRWSHRRGFRSVYLVKAAVAWQRFVLPSSMHSPPTLLAESPWVGRRFESIRINRGEKDEHCGDAYLLRVLSRFSLERALHVRPFHFSLSALCTRCPRRLAFSSKQRYLQSYQKESRLFRGSLSCERSEFEEIQNLLGEAEIQMS